MTMKSAPKWALLGLLIIMSTSLQAQKVGHVNYGNLLESLPQIKAAEESLNNYQDSLAADLEARVKAHQTRIANNQKRFQAGELSKMVADSINLSLNAEKNLLREDQQKAEATILIRRQQKVQPIVLAVNEAIAKYGKDNGYDLIIDESSSLILYDRPADDLTDAIRKMVAQ